MVRLTKIYTKGGDKGETSLGDGNRVRKHHQRVVAYGTVDEANAFLGLCLLHCDEDIKDNLQKIQNDMFDLGADLCVPETVGKNIDQSSGQSPGQNSRHDAGKKSLRITAPQVIWLEKQIDTYNASLSPLSSFVLPSGSALATALHIARTVVRRAERETTLLAEIGAVNPHAITYLNRLSDLLFVWARYANDKGSQDILWTPGANR